MIDMSDEELKAMGWNDLQILFINGLCKENEELKVENEKLKEKIFDAKKYINHHLTATNDKNVGSLITALKKLED